MQSRLLTVSILASLAAVAGVAAVEVPITGQVVGSGGSPLSDAQVLLLPVVDPVTAARLDREGRLPEPAAKAVTTSQGLYRLTAPRAGIYRVRVEAPGFAPRQFLLVPLLEPADLVEAKLARDTGIIVRVADRAGAPIEGASVHIAEPETRYVADSRWMVPPSTVFTGKDGTAHLARAETDLTVLTISAPGYLLAERRGIRGNSFTVKLEKGQPVAIEVKDVGGAPVPGVLAVTGPTNHPLGSTDANGRLGLAVPPRGEVPLTLLAADGRQIEARISPPPKDRPGPLRLVLPERLTLSGRVIDLETRRPLAGALVWNEGRPWEAVPTDDSGGYALGADRGTGDILEGGAPGYLRSEPRMLTAPPRGRPGPTLALEPAAAVEGVVVDAHGQPVAGADVSVVRRMEGGRFQFFIGGRPDTPHAMTSSRGRFRLSPVDASPRYDLTVSAKGFAPASRELPPLERRRTLDIQRIELARGRKALGRVLDGEKRPIRDASVLIRPALRRGEPVFVAKASGGAAKPEERTAVSDASGRFEIAALAAGTFDLEVRRKGFARKTLERVEVADAAEPADLGDIVLAPGERIQGRVADPSGKPIDGVEISIGKDAAGPMGFGPGPSGPPDAVTGPDGWFSIEDLLRGEALALAFARTGYLAKRQTGIAVPGRDPLEVVLHPSSKVSGAVVDLDSKPVPFAQVTLTQQRGGGVGGQRMMMVMRRQSAADGAGRFLFEDVEPGKIDLAANATGWQKAKLDDLEVTEGQDLTGVEIPLKPGTSVEGRVLAPDGQPAVGAEVSKVAEQAEMVRFRGTATDGDGNYRIEGLAPGKVSVEATHESWARVVRDIEARPGTNTLDLQFQGGQDVSGRVLDVAGAPIAAAWVRLAAPGHFFGGPDATSGSDGSFKFESVGAGDYELSAGKRGFASPAEGTAVHVADAPVAGLEVRLAAGAVLTGAISGLDPDKLAQVEVHAAKAGEPWPRSDSSVDRQGHYRIDDLAAGSWRVSASHPPSGQQARGDVTIPPGATEASLDLRIGGGLTLSGRVVQGEASVAGADVFAQGADVDSSGRGRTDSNGRFSVGGLEPGTYRLELNQWESGLFHEETVEVSAPREIVVRVPTARVSGRVVDSTDRRPVSGARVAVDPQDGDTQGSSSFRLDRSATTDLDGRFAIANVSDGAWRLTATAQGYAAQTTTATVKSGHDVENVGLALEPTEGLSLEVLLPSGRSPDEVVVAVLDPGGRAVVSGSFATGENGRVRLSTVPTGSWDLLVGASGSGTASLRVSAPGGPVLVALPPACTLDVSVPGLEGSQAVATATVTGADGRPFRELARYDDPRGQWRLTAGRVRIEDLPPGTWTVSVSASDGRTWNGSAQTTPGTPTPLTLE